MVRLLVDDVVKDDDDKNGNDYRQPGFDIGEHLTTPLGLLKKYVIMYPLYRVLVLFFLVLKLEGAKNRRIASNLAKTVFAKRLYLFNEDVDAADGSGCKVEKEDMT